MTASTPVPGWYPDPSDAGLIRWWDGSAWTVHVQPVEAVSAPAPASTATTADEVAAIAAERPITIAPDGFLLPDPQATPGRRADPPPARRELTNAPVATGGNAVQLSRRELRQRETASAESSSAPSTSPPQNSAPQHSAPHEPRPAGEQLPPVTAAPPPSPAPTIAPPGAAGTTAGAAAGAAVSAAAASSSSTAAANTAFRPEVLPRMSVSTGPVAVDDRFADLFGESPTATLPTTSTEPGPAPELTPAPAQTPAPDFSEPLPASPAAPQGAASPLPTEPPIREATPPPEAPRASRRDADEEPDDSFARPWVSVAGEAVPLSAVELASVDYEPLPPSRGGPSARSLPTVPTRSATASSWMLALSPLLIIGAVVGGFALAAALGFQATVPAPLLDLAAPALIVGTPPALTALVLGVASDPLGGPLVLGVLALLTVLVIVWAVLDRRALGRHGFSARASAGWIILGPFVYLIARAVATARAGRSGAAPLWTHVGLVVTLIAAAGAAPFLVPREATVADMRFVEQTIASDLAAQDVDLAVLCPDVADARIGAQFVCDALDAERTVVGLITVRWTGVDGSIEYSVELANAPVDAAG